jgi:hypothetical protein
MKTIIRILAIMLCILAWPAAQIRAQVFPVDTLLYSGDIGKFINLVIISDGYMENEIAKFHTDAASFESSFFSETPFNNYVNYFNVFTIDVPSPESGAKHPGTAPDCGNANPPVPIADPDNYFGSTFDYAAIHRLVVPLYSWEVTDVLATNFPQYDVVLVLVNSPYYGGSGGSFATSTTETSSTEISKHEIGHSFAGLADEYWSGFPGEHPNMTMESDPSLIRWKNWLNYNGIGIYPYPSSPDWYKPSVNCKMEALYNLFCSVCTEAFVETIHNLVSPVMSFSPDTSSVIGAGEDTVLFSLETVDPVPNTLRRQWSLDGLPAGYNTDSVSVAMAALAPGAHHLDALVLDTIDLTRDSLHTVIHLYAVQWDIMKYYAGVTVGGSSNSVMLDTWPNPFADQMTVTWQADKPATVEIAIVDARGRVIETVHNASKEQGRHQLTISADRFGPPGVYFIRITMNGMTYSNPVIRE